MGSALARSVLAEVLGSREVRLALAVLRGGSDANHRLVALCEMRLSADGRWEGRMASNVPER